VRRLAIALVVACGSKSSPPKPVEKLAPACAAVADHMLELVEPKDEHAKKIREIFAVRCEQDAWSGDARACVMSTTSLKDPKGCKAKLAVPQREALERDLAAADKAARDAKLTSCELYKQRIELLMSCDKLPQQSRDALKQGLDAMMQGWTQMENMPEEARKAMQDGCKQGVDALEAAAGDMCGW